MADQTNTTNDTSADGEKVRVRFLTTKRFPHPNGQRRYRGDEVAMEPRLALRWSENGIVEIVDGDAEARLRESDPVQALIDTSLSDLEAAVADVDDPPTLRDAITRDGRKGARPIYEARLNELSNPQGDTGGDGEATQDDEGDTTS